MKGNVYKAVLCLFIAAAMISCAAQKPQVMEPAFEPVDLNGKLQSGQYAPKVDTYMIILDASQSMSEKYNGQTKFDIAKSVVSRLNQTLPDMEVNSALRTFGHGTCLPQEETLLINEVRPYSKMGLDEGLAKVACDGGNSPLVPAIEAASADLAPTQGNIALIIVSDGKDMGEDRVVAAQKMKQQFGDRLCIYTVLVGNDPKGRILLEKIASAGQCGFAVNADEIYTAAGMANFVENVFLTESMDGDGDGVTDDLDQCPDTAKGVAVDDRGCPPDSDGDGVFDYLDQCPNTPAGLEVDKWGCPMDSDGDGVYDSMDKCPNSPAGAAVDETGCSVYENVQFDFNKSSIKPRYFPSLGKIASILAANPDMRIQIQGHTDNIGSQEYNQSLSEQRAMAVKQYLVNKGADPQQLSTEGFGFSMPAAPNDTPAGRAQNRRAGFEVMP